jgi:hypothetical protein
MADGWAPVVQQTYLNKLWLNIWSRVVTIYTIYFYIELCTSRTDYLWVFRIISDFIIEQHRLIIVAMKTCYVFFAVRAVYNKGVLFQVIQERKASLSDVTERQSNASTDEDISIGTWFVKLFPNFTLLVRQKRKV